MSRTSHCLVSRFIDGDEVIGFMLRLRFTAQEYFWYSFLLEAE
jgi:hypothetical protein